MTQADRVLALLQSRGPEGITVLDFATGFRLSGRIKDLRDAGHHIDTHSQELPGGTRVARYTLTTTPTFAPMTGAQERLAL